MSAGALTLEGVTKSYGDLAVLRGVSLTVPAGSVAALLGPSGCGKTTLLRAIAGFERPDAGTITIGPDVVNDDSRFVRPERRRVGYVSQDGSLFPHLSVAGNVGFGLPRARRDARVAELLDVVGLARLRDRYPHELSGGQQQRVAIARALAVDPVLVLLDEPFAALDDALRQSVRDDVIDILSTHGATTVLVTHDQDEALSTAHLVAVLRDGVVAQVASPADLYAHPADAGLATLIGGANVLAGTRRGDVVETVLGTLAVRAGTGPDGEVSVLVRPEQVQIDPTRAVGVPGRVAACRFHGHDVVVSVALEVGHDLTVRVLGSDTYEVGREVAVAVTSPVTVLASG